MIGEDFMYGSTWLSEWSMKMYDPEESQSFVTRNIDKSEITAQRAKPNHFTTTYSDALVLNFFILRDEDDCETQEDFKLTGDDIHYLRSWLESPKKPKELVVLMGEDETTTYYYGIFTSVQPFIHRGDCYGLYLEFTCNAPYGYSEEIKKVYDISSDTLTYTVKYRNYSAELNEYLKPTIIITSTSTFNGEGLVIQNLSDDENSMTITLPSGKSKVIIDCEKKIITDENDDLLTMNDIGVTTPDSSDYNFISTDSYLFYWLSLVPNTNKLKFTLTSGHAVKNIQISTRYIIKSGGF